jgi:hypothetical protein
MALVALVLTIPEVEFDYFLGKRNVYMILMVSGIIF